MNPWLQPSTDFPVTLANKFPFCLNVLVSVLQRNRTNRRFIYIYIYIYGEKEREREGGREKIPYIQTFKLQIFKDANMCSISIRHE